MCGRERSVKWMGAKWWRHHFFYFGGHHNNMDTPTHTNTRRDTQRYLRYNPWKLCCSAIVTLHHTQSCEWAMGRVDRSGKVSRLGVSSSCSSSTWSRDSCPLLDASRYWYPLPLELGLLYMDKPRLHIFDIHKLWVFGIVWTDPKRYQQPEEEESLHLCREVQEELGQSQGCYLCARGKQKQEKRWRPSQYSEIDKEKKMQLRWASNMIAPK